MSNDLKTIRRHRKLGEVLGEKEADTLMELLLPARWDPTALRNGVKRSVST